MAVSLADELGCYDLLGEANKKAAETVVLSNC